MLKLLAPFIITQKTSSYHLVCPDKWLQSTVFFYVQLHEFEAVFFFFFSETNPYVVSNTFYDNVMIMMNVLCCYIFKTQ